MEKMIFKELLASFGVPLKIYRVSDEKGTYVNGEWRPQEFKATDYIAVSEPFIPSSLATQMPTMSQYQATRLEKHDMIWFSSLVVPTKTIVVTVEGREFSVEEEIPYTDYSDVTQYGCRAVSISVPRVQL